MNAQAQLDPAQVLAADPDWWRGAVIYQIYPRSYQDSNGDGIGDLRGITQRLPYIAALGVDAIWISPFFTSPMKDFGYDVSDYCDVDPMFGSLSDFDQLVAAAHRLGLRVMIDLVLSHTSDQHAWFGESRQNRDNDRADWYVWADPQPDGTPPNNWLSIFGGSAWQWDPRREQYYLHNFLVSQPDLNFHCPAVQDALLDVTRFWLERGVDGFRLDTINFYFHDAELRSNPALPPEQRNATIAPSVNPYNHQEHLYSKNQPENLAFLGRFRALLDEYPAKAAVGEVGDAQRGLEIMGSYTAANTGVHMCYAFELLAKDVLTASRLAEVFAEVDRVAANGWACWAFSNHDVIRHSSRWGLNPAAQRLFTTMMMCLRGTACIYQGEELGLPEADIAFEDLQDPYGIEFWPEFKGRDGCRTPMVWEPSNGEGGFSEGKPWLPVSPEHLNLSVASQEADPEAMLHHYRRAIALRKTHPALAVGTHDQLRAEGNVAFFTRQDRAEVIFCAFNLGDTPAEISLPEGMWRKPETDIALADLPDGGRQVALAPWQACLAVRV
ncbi:alpha-amylase family glycosyl hydrolase [Phaeobacter gallaeciensis]|uniref:Alpha-glucosidase AglA n=1 Tax=Phaeobacter gallaeciensis TaxID=60890 RepID=A0AAC9ZAV6_9RHOB|nr:alpha-amylase family glycosyl hydrolase [Phaeobacter gallaeciensis]AHD10436.1 Glycosidase [Phaeobacter gallaeciensis DSM 26640]ATE93699.1 putative alpha-glucosidase AglA [Phaeobacter gallaeciensis]ATE96480.1 putative alpha-glucosidase AglA [Phaeobacter gallaeciensis]ATF02363.1 putative alpha-glucosidase AglA [Phaeobacter gallaeciensis]ATF06743.1 putative alpha-glucosidase AglA [Phaeobacter gallaeciensis]